MFLVSIFSADFYMSPPMPGLDVLYSEFRGAPTKSLPIIRIFGSNEQGVKACLHVHGAFPYVYVPFDGSDPEGAMQQLAIKLDKAINMSFGQSSSTAKHVYKISSVSGIPFYGYHAHEYQFFKIYFYNPLIVKRASSLIQNTDVLGETYQLHEAHIPFVLQFMIDYNLHGMNYITLSQVTHRFDDVKTSRCKLEADCLVDHIINKATFALNPGIAALWEDERLRDPSVSPCVSQARTCVSPTDSHLRYKDELSARLLLTADDSQTDSVYPSFDDTFDVSLNDSVTVDLMRVLTELGENVDEDDDCVLSQTVKQDESDEEDMVDMSLPIETPVKMAIVGGSTTDELSIKYPTDSVSHQEFTPDEIGTSSKIENAKRQLDFGPQSPGDLFNDDEICSLKSDVPIFSSQKLGNLFRGPGVITPKIGPPTRRDVLDTLIAYKIPQETFKVPFYSDHHHVTGQIRVGHNVMHINRLGDFPQFAGNFGSLASLRNVRLQGAVCEVKSAFCGSGKLVVAPVKNPPDRSQIVAWLKNTVKGEKKVKETKVKRRVFNDPGANSEDEDYVSLEPLSCESPKRSGCNESQSGELTPTSSKEFAVKNIVSSNNDLISTTGSYALKNSDLSYEVTRTNLILSNKAKNCTTNNEAPTNTSSNESTSQYFALSNETKYSGSSNDSASNDIPSSNELTPKKSDSALNKSNSSNNFTPNNLSSSPVLKKSHLRNRLTTCSTSKPKRPKNRRRFMRKSLLQSQLYRQLSPANYSNSLNITEASRDNTCGFLMPLENLQTSRESPRLTIFAMELLVRTRGDLKPDPELDEILAIFYLVKDVTETTGVLVNGVERLVDGVYLASETELLEEFVRIVGETDPDILVGYEVEMASWGYLLERGTALKLDLKRRLARSDNVSDTEDKVTGRVLLDVWRLMRHEIALQSYTFENVAFHVLHKRLPLYSFSQLADWWDLKRVNTVAKFYLERIKTTVELLENLDIVGRTTELARLFGIQFYEVLSRGSQFRVESMMLRLAKPLNYLAVSPSPRQRATMKAPEFLPLILEPHSKFYADPVIVLDFQSLYPSIMIAYNYCFSTCLGQVDLLGRNLPFAFGATNLKVSRARLKRFHERDLLNYSPCGVAFVEKTVREGVLPRMLAEILEARLMVKAAMKRHKGNRILQRVLHSRQLGLKLIANVTYGYTAANFSGRMPLVELGDSVVSKGRETLLRAIKLIETRSDWGAKVVYGDTDSIFVLVTGRSRQVAFEIGAEIAEAVTKSNPNPVKLKLEKVFHPCILQTKKRYVGYMYESADETEPQFCAKGIETVRRDGCPAASKMLEKSLKLLFDTRDVSLVQKYVLRQFDKLLSMRISVQDLTFAKEYRGLTSYRPGACVPALELARRWISVDKRNEPRRGERVPYVIVNGPPGLPLIRLVRSPRELLLDSSQRPNILYYITKVIIPPLNRCFLLIGADLNLWFNNMPRKQMRILATTPDSTSKKRSISHYFATINCVACNQQTYSGLCENCLNSPQNTIAYLHGKIKYWEQTQQDLTKICQSCCNTTENIIQCISLDCPNLYRLRLANHDLQRVPSIREIISKNFD